MDQQLRSFLEDLHRHGSDHDAVKQERLERLRNLEPETAELLAVLVRSAQPRRILELGSSNGYSTVWLADAARAVGAALVSIEIDPARTEQARENLRAAGLGESVELRSEDAALALAASEDDEWDLIFLDAERSAYPGYWPELIRALAPGGLLVVDNAVSHAGEMSVLRERIDADARVLDALVPTGAGALLVVKELGRVPGG
jgi:predicted O-methyltransferase YrrM